VNISLLIKLEKNNFIFYFLVISWIFSLIIFYIFSSYINAGFLVDGYKFGNDTYFYLGAARDIINGNLPADKNAYSYMGFVIFLTFFKYFNIHLFFIVLFQIFLTFVSAILLFKITENLYSRLAGYFVIIFFFFYFPLQIRNFFILTDLIFINLSIISIYFLIFLNIRKFIFFIIFVICMISFRPHGIIIIPIISFSTLIYFLFLKKYKFLILWLIINLILITPSIFLINLFINNESIIDTIVKGEIIWGYENIKKINENLIVLENHKTGIFGLLTFVYDNLIYYLEIFYLKIYWFFARIRPYYSFNHNTYILIFNFILYPALLCSLFIKTKNIFGKITLISYLLIFSIAIGLSFVDWSGRFSLYIYPFIFILSSGAIAKLLEKMIKKNN